MECRALSVWPRVLGTSGGSSKGPAATRTLQTVDEVSWGFSEFGELIRSQADCTYLPQRRQSTHSNVGQTECDREQTHQVAILLRAKFTHIISAVEYK